MEKTPQFPDYFPEDCPPVEAKSIDFKVFRLSKHANLTEDTFKSFYQINPERWMGVIQSYGISVFHTKEDCESALRKSPCLKKRMKYYAFGIANKDSGKIMKTPSKDNPRHYTWWLYEGVKPHTYFKVCKV